ncbi:hypothetical protein [Bradyrhizobium diazoefficiens]|uniref:hypothetical protein n=1 Tax=Bradyrhizobium diazoefficiens TaxID=1355477 RepID=UPI001FEE090B|nr:hypothetical protein [Bradyrhizobium diazoefficiens]
MKRHLASTVAAASLTCALLLIASGETARATDEIQVYNAGIADVGQFTIQQHLNYVAIGQKDPPFPGGFPSNHSLNGTPEFAYGMTDWWELGLYLPFAVQDRQFLSDAFKLRTLFVSPHAEQQNLFYGVNFELSYEMPKFAQTRWGLEIRPIIGVRNSQYEFIVNPIVDIGFGSKGEADFAPAARLARNFGNDLFAGFEYYADFGEIGNFSKLPDQQHTLFAVTDFKAGVFDVNFGVGYGLTPASDRFVVKTIIGYAFSVPGQKPDANMRMSSGPVNPFIHAAARGFQP